MNASEDRKAARTIRRLVGVYHADGTLLGEVSYFVGARLGRAHCSLCDITHGLVRERPEWRAARAGWSVPFDTFHRNDQPDDVRRATDNRTPVVVAVTDSGVVVLLGSDDVDRCHGSVAELQSRVKAAAARAGLDWPGVKAGPSPTDRPA
jgi:hypothetical protein